MPVAYLGLGANMGDKRANLRAAVNMLRECGCRVLSASSLYGSRPVGVVDQPDFVNAVVAVDTGLSPRQLLNACLSIEERMGRERTIRWGPRVIDIDVLLYESVYITEADLQIPHPRMLERAFVMEPLAEIAPEMLLSHGKTAREAAEEVRSSDVHRIDAGQWTE